MTIKSPSYSIYQVIGYLKSNFDETNYEFTFFHGGHSTILSTSFGVQLNYLLNNLHDIPLKKISTRLKDQQDPKTGLFIDKKYDQSDISNFEEEYVLWQFTYFATIALDMMDEKPRYPFKFLEIIKDKLALDNWLKKQDFVDFWYTSNKIMFLLYFLIYEQKRVGYNNHEYINAIFNKLDNSQDSNTGFWGTQKGASLLNGMFGAAHIYLFYQYYNKDIKYKKQILENLLKLQNPYGLFGSKFGGACEDYNAIEIASTLYKNESTSPENICKEFYNTYTIIKNNQNQDGGFSYKIDNRSIFEKIADKLKNKNYYYFYSGWNKMESNSLKSDLWGTYFRVLTIAKIEQMFEIDSDHEYKFYSLPGWGY